MEAEATALVRVIRVIDAISAWSGRIVAWLIVPLIVVMTWEICVRYLMRPTLWAYDLSYMIYGAMFMLGSAYTLYRGAHIRTDFLYQNWPVKVQATVDAACYLLLFFPGVALFLWIGTDQPAFWTDRHMTSASPLQLAFQASDRLSVELFMQRPSPMAGPTMVRPDRGDRKS